MKRIVVAASLLLLAASGCGVGSVKNSGTPPPKTPARSSSAPSSGAPSVPQSAGPVTVKTASLKPLQGALPNLTLTGASFLSDTKGWVAGAFGHIQGASGTAYTGGFVASTSDGKTWTVAARLPGKVLDSVHFVSAQVGYAVGGALPKSGSNEGAFGTQNTLFVTQDGGRTWSPLWKAGGTITDAAFPASGGVLLSVKGPCTAKACQGAIYRLKGPASNATRLVQTAGPVISLASLPANIFVTEVLPKSQKAGVTVRVISSQDGGQHWSASGALPAGPELSSYFTTASRLTSSMGFSSAKDGFVTLFSMDSCAMHGCGVADVYRTQNGGSTWTKAKDVGVSCAFSPVLAVEKGAAAAAEGVNLGACPGPEDTLFATVGASGAFKTVAHFQQLGITAMGFTPSGRLWALGRRALVLSVHPLSGTPKWAQVFPAQVPTGIIHFVSAKVGYAAGDAMDPGAILKTTDGGATWQVLASLAGRKATSLSFTGGGVGYAGTVSELAESQQPAILKTTDGGVTWHVVYRASSSFTFYPEVRFFSAQKGVLLNLNVNCTSKCQALTMTTSDGGRQWARVVSPQGPGDVVSATALTPQELRVATMATRSNPATLDASSDGGKTWRTLATLPSDVDGLLDVDFVSPSVGFVAAEHVVRPGGNGKIQISHAAVLETTDGGKHFTLYDLPGLSGDWSASISFISPSIGWLRSGSTLWKTVDGGKSWQQVR